MTDYTKLVEALRFCFSQSGHGCGLCPYKDHKKPCDAGLLAADAIEKLVTLYEKAEMDATNLTGKLAQAEAQLPKRGEWVEENRRPRSSQFVCSECHRTAYDPQPTRDKAWRKRCRYAYCPNCGAKMEVQDG